jgi:hypothetical protein
MSVLQLRRQLHLERDQLVDLALCWHESGHFTTARALSYAPDGCSIDSPGVGSTRFTYPTSDRETPEGRRRLLAIYLAGSVAEHIRFGKAIMGESAKDRSYINELLAFERDQPARIDAQSAATDLAARLLRADWEFASALASELREKRSWGAVAA